MHSECACYLSTPSIIHMYVHNCGQLIPVASESAEQLPICFLGGPVDCRDQQTLGLRCPRSIRCRRSRCGEVPLWGGRAVGRSRRPRATPSPFRRVPHRCLGPPGLAHADLCQGTSCASPHPVRMALPGGRPCSVPSAVQRTGSFTCCLTWHVPVKAPLSPSVLYGVRDNGANASHVPETSPGTGNAPTSFPAPYPSTGPSSVLGGSPLCPSPGHDGPAVLRWLPGPAPCREHDAIALTDRLLHERRVRTASSSLHASFT